MENFHKDDKTGKLGTFSGVFTPSILTILGIILFMRLGYVVGSAGFGRALIMIGLANVISILTSISLSAIATNIKVKGGGDYYLISRTLGVEFGGAIGIVLFLAQSVSIAFYCIGFGEVVGLMLAENTYLSPRIIAALAVILLFVLAWLGTDWATKFQFGVMVLLMAAIVSFFVGGLASWDSMIFFQNWQPSSTSPEFWILFAIFFPAVTGFTQGVSMSGDLKDPGKSLPLGTFLAVGLSILVYFAVAIIFAGVLPNQTLMMEYDAMKRVAVFGGLIDAGVISATLSSAMASFLGAPRILQSLAGDRVFPFMVPFAKVYGANGNPRRGVLLSAAIAFATLGLGNLNLIARVVSMFFLISYGLLNYATYFEARSKSPSFRPTFKWFNLRLSFIGFLSCLGVMLAIDIKNGMIAIAVLFAIYEYLKRTGGQSRWADGTRSYHLKQVRDHLIAASKEPDHPRDWRPQVLAFTNHSERRPQLLQFALWIGGGSGLTTAVQILQGKGLKMRKIKAEALKTLSQDIMNYDLKAFPLVISAEDLGSAMQILTQTYGVGPVKANTILTNWFDQLGKGLPGIENLQYAQNIRTLFRMGCNILILSSHEKGWENLSDIPSEERQPKERQIDIWWQDNATGRLMLMFAYLMTRNEIWEDAKIRLLAEENKHHPEGSVDGMKKMLDDFRIKAVPEIVMDMKSDTVSEMSKKTDMVFYPFRIQNYKLMDLSGESLERILKNIPNVALVKAAEDIDLTAEPEEGIAGEIAAAVEELSDARKKEIAATEIAKETQHKVNALKEKIEDIKNNSFSINKNEDVSQLNAEIHKAQEDAEKALRKALKASKKSEEAAKKIEELGGIPPDQ